MTERSAPNRADVMDILKDDKSVTYGVDEASRHLTFVLSPRQTNCVNRLGGDHHGSTVWLSSMPPCASSPSCSLGTTSLTLLVSSRQTRLTSAAHGGRSAGAPGGGGGDHSAGELSGLQTGMSHSARRPARKTSGDSHTPSLTPPSSSLPSSSRTPFAVGWWLRCTCVCAAGRSTGAGRDR